jgi:hypothetical protein
MPNLSKRDILAVAAAAAIGLSPALPAGADPIYALIDAHRESIKAWDEALRFEQNHPWRQAHSRKIKAWLSQDDRREEDYPDDAKPQDLIDAEKLAEELDDRESAAADELVAMTPTTLAGALAALRYVTSYYNGDSETFPGQSHDLLNDDDFLNFIDGIGDAIEAAIGQAA